MLEYLETSLKPAITANDIMTREVTVIPDATSLLDAAILLEKINHTGCPVVDGEGRLVGFVTLRDIMKGRRADQMHAPVKGYMSRKVITAERQTTVREMEELLLSNNIGHLPIMDDGRIAGIVTRSDYLAFRKAEKRQAEAIQESLS
jgi:tRNA nucleotidyltransferase (CCA-adding enzyme)